MKISLIQSLRQTAALAAAFTLSLSFADRLHAGTAIGPFPQFNGGFEAENVGTVPILSSIASNTVSSFWTVQNNSSASGVGPSIVATGGRSGPFFLTNYSCSVSGARRLQSPTAAGGTVAPGTSYIIQLYYRTTGAANATNFTPGISTTGTGSPNYVTAKTLNGSSGAWTKFTVADTTVTGIGGVPTALGIAVIRFSSTNNNAIDVDDFCVYPGTTPDITPPDPASAPSILTQTETTITAGWTDPVTGVDGGGYMVVRSAISDPTAVPSSNGIYAVGNTVSDGVGVSGIVAYLGVNPTFKDTGLSGNTQYFYRIYTVDKAFNYSTSIAFTGTTASTLSAPSGISISPSDVTNNFGSAVTFTSTVAAGDPPYSYFWYQETPTTTNLVATTPNLTLGSVTGASAGSYQVVVSNTAGTASSVPSALTIIGDPHIVLQPTSADGLVNGTVQFVVSAVGTAPNYQWYFTDASGNPIATVTDGNSTASGVAVVSGANGSTLTIANLQPLDPTNFIVVVSNNFGMVTSAVVSLVEVVTSGATLAFWDFNGPEFTNTLANPNSINNPVPFLGSGLASAVGSCQFPPTSPFSGSVDPENGPGTTLHLPNFSWGTLNYSASGSNKLNGVQFMVSTVGAKDIRVSYDSRTSATGSDFERLQFTTNAGANWIDYPASSTFNNSKQTIYFPYNYSLVGFPGVDNNAGFGFRVVTEIQSTASYGVSTNTNYLGTGNTYGTAGTATYDLVNVTGNAITNNNAPPSIDGFPLGTNTPDSVPITIPFTVLDTTTPPDSLTYSAVSLPEVSGFNLSPTVNPAFTFGGTGTSRTLTVTPSPIAGSVAVGPILVTVADPFGNSFSTWFYLTNTSANLPPTNGLTSISTTNMLANTSITIPFKLGDDRTPISGLTFSAVSANQTVLPNASVVLNGVVNGSNSITITPASNQLGLATISVTVNDNDSLEPKSTTANIALLVRPNTNVIAIDYFNYDNSGGLDAVSDGYWSHLSGPFGQMQVGSGSVIVDTLNNTENVQAGLLGAPYGITGGAVLYASFMVSMSADITGRPFGNGTYFAVFNDGSGVTGNYECRIIAATNGAAPGSFRLGVNNFGADALSGVMFPLDLVPGTTNLVVTALQLTNGFSTLWVNPYSPSSASVTDTTTFDQNGSSLFNISDIELRESGSAAGTVSVSKLKVGTSFDAVLPSINIRPDPAGPNVILTWSDSTIGIQSATNILGAWVDVTGAASPYTNTETLNATTFFRLGQ